MLDKHRKEIIELFAKRRKARKEEKKEVKNDRKK